MNDSSVSSSSLPTKLFTLPDGSTVSYVCIPPSVSTKSSLSCAVVHFGPLSACSASTTAWTSLWHDNDDDEKGITTTAWFITVDRPGCHETSPIPDHDDDDEEEDWVLKRLRINTRNVVAVLQALEIDTVYILAVCLGHAYAIHFARELLRNNTTIQLRDISLVAPFVSTACPQTWFLARIGHAVPFMVLSTATHAMVALGATLTPWLLTPSAVKNMLSTQEQAAWKDPDDYEYACQLISATAPMTRHVRAIEAQFGSSHVWQQVIDDFSKKAGYGLHNGTTESPILEYKENRTTALLFPRIKIHVSPHDGMVTVAAAKWLAQRCYADCDVVLHEEMSSHMTMTLFGGPPRNPVLLRHICQDEFGILLSK